MANNINVKDGNLATQVVKTTDNAGVHTPHKNIEIAGVPPTVGAGAADASTLRVAIVSDQDTVAISVADAADVALGAVADAAVADGAAGTISAKLRTVTADLGTIKTSLTAIQGYTDGLEGFVDGLEGFTDGLEGFTDGLETLLAGGLPATLGQKAMAASLAVVLPSDQSAIPVTLSGNGAVTIADGADVALGAVADAAATQGGTGTISAKLRLVTSQLNTLAGHLDGLETLLNGGLPAALGQGTMAQSLRVVLPSDQSAVPVAPAVASTPVATQPSADTSADIILAARAARKGGLIRNNHASITAFIGASGVVAGTGYELRAGESMPWPCTGDAYAITASGTCTFSVIEWY